MNNLNYLKYYIVFVFLVGSLFFSTSAYGAMSDDLRNATLYYAKFNNNLTDSTGIYTATSTNISFSSSFGLIAEGIKIFSTGSSSRVNINSFDLPSPYTVATWVKPRTKSATGYRRIAESRYDTGFFLGLDAEGDGYTAIIANIVCSGGTVSTSTWSLVAVTYDESNIKLWVNNSVVNTCAKTGHNHLLNKIRIGNSSIDDSDLPMDGYIDEFGIFNMKLDTDQMSYLYNVGVGLTYPFTITASSTPVATTTVQDLLKSYNYMVILMIGLFCGVMAFIAYTLIRK